MRNCLFVGNKETNCVKDFETFRKERGAANQSYYSLCDCSIFGIDICINAVLERIARREFEALESGRSIDKVCVFFSNLESLGNKKDLQVKILDAVKRGPAVNVFIHAQCASCMAADVMPELLWSFDEILAYKASSAVSMYLFGDYRLSKLSGSQYAKADLASPRNLNQCICTNSELLWGNGRNERCPMHKPKGA